MSLEKLLRLTGQQGDQAATGDDLRELARAIHLTLSEATSTDDPAAAAELVFAAAAAAEGLDSALYGEGMDDWVEATAGQSQAALALSGGKPSGEYADPGYQNDGKPRYPVDTEEHVRASNSYISKAGNARVYSAQQLAKIKATIHAAMQRHSIGTSVAATAVLGQLQSGDAWVMLAAAPAGQQGIPMHHAPFSGTHTHAHKVSMTHDHEHTHVNDSQHDGTVHGSNAGQKAWAAKGEASWAKSRENW
jgi:hypothetical protein